MYLTTSIEKVVQREAYQIYQQRIREGRPGDSKQDWFEAIKRIGLINDEEDL